MQRMPIALHQLPDDVDALKSLVADQFARNEQLTTENQRYKVQVLTLTEQLSPNQVYYSQQLLTLAA